MKEMNMKNIFSDGFMDDKIYNWKTEQHVPDGYPDFIIRDQALVMLDAGNRILPLISELKTFLIKGCFETDSVLKPPLWGGNANKFSLQIYFAYDQHIRQGSMLDIDSDGNTMSVSLSHAGKVIVKKKLNSSILGNILKNQVVNFELEVNRGITSLTLDGEKCFTHAVDSGAGFIALSRGAFTGELRMKYFEIATDDDFDQQVIWDRLSIPFAPINGMDNPIVWTVSAHKLGDIIKLEVELAGGVKDRKHIEWFPFHMHYTEQLYAPYLRIESSQQCMEFLLTGKTLTLCNPWSRSFYLLAFEKPQWPLKKSFFIESLDSQNAVLFCGYKSYANTDANCHQAAGRSETAYDCKSGRIIYYGQAIEPDTVVFDIKSPGDKQICKAIPQSVHEYEKALQFARENHYFLEDETCCFHFELFSRMGDAKTELHVEYRLENAFFEPLDEYQPVGLEDASESIALNIEKLQSRKITFNKLEAGVYHVSFRLYQGRELLQEKRRAFEVMSQKMSGPQASRLPKLFSMAHEVMGIDTDPFDPWKPDCVDVSHYISIGASVHPQAAREKRLWELYKVYGRQWFLWLANWTAKDWDMERNCDIVEHCDYLKSYNAIEEKRNGYVRNCFRQTYTGSVLHVLYDFALENNFYPEKIKSFIDGNTIPDKETFNELVDKHFYKWIDYFCDRFLDSDCEKKKQIAAISGNVKYASYGPTAIYAGAYKTAHSARYSCAFKHTREIENIYDGFLVFDDYPHACRYSINRGLFLLASTKMIWPKLKLYPEIYGPWLCPCPDAAVGRAWPTLGIIDNYPLESSVKAAIEFVYAAVWHDGEKFNYWQDYGFHTRTWEWERFEALLRAWGFVDKVKAARPLKANAFICNEDCCENHVVYYDEYPGSSHEAAGDLFNTAEESIAYAYEMSRYAGQNAGFVTDFKSLAKLTARDIDILVIPPLTKIRDSDLDNIRDLHEQGVSLLAFEEVPGLEDLFGVKEGEIRQVSNITVNKTLANNPLAKLAGLAEYTEHRACKGKYRSAGADVLLDGEVPALFAHRTRWGKTALFNIPPTVVRRQDQINRCSLGRDSISQLINRATQHILKYLSSPAVETDAGKIIAFSDTNDTAHIIIEEDAHPMPAVPIKPLLTLNIPGLSVEKISCDKTFSIVSISENSAKLRLTLQPDEFAIITIKNRL